LILTGIHTETLHKQKQAAAANEGLGDRPVANRSAQPRYVKLVEEVGEGGIRWWLRKFDTKSDAQNTVVADGKALQIQQALTTAQGL